MPAGLRDVAARAGVSAKTVSNVVNGSAPVTARTRERVEQALRELNYRPNLSARNLRKSRSGIVALALPELDAPYFAELARCVIKAAEERSWTVLIDQTDGLREREEQVLAGIREHLIDGLIFSPLALGRADLAGRRDDTPLVLLGERIYDGPADHVAIDNVGAARVATEHLLAIGRRRVAAIGDQRQASGETARLRLEGYRRALVDAGVGVSSDLIVPAETYRRADGARAMARLLEGHEPPDAVFCFSDPLALGALRTLLSRGYRVPEDVAVVGFDDVEDGRFSTPTLTTIAPAKDDLARTAIELLHSRVAGRRTAAPREVRAAFELAVRESTVGADPSTAGGGRRAIPGRHGTA